MVHFGQLVIGPPGAGKTTYCHGMQQMCRALDRKCSVINLDPANDETPYECALDIKDLVKVSDVMDEFNLGPNGALIYCMEYLLKNVDWLEESISTKFTGHYLVVDCPGQVELYTHHQAILDVCKRLQKSLDVRVRRVHLIDSVLCSEPSTFISALLASLGSQLLLELPHVNVLSKVDLLQRYRKDLAFKLEYYAEVQNLTYLLQAIEPLAADHHPFDRKFKKLNAALCEVVEDFNLVAFLPLNIEDKRCVLNVLKQTDTANGYNLSAYFNDPAELYKLTIPATLGLREDLFGDLQERYIDDDDDEEEEDE